MRILLKQSIPHSFLRRGTLLYGRPQSFAATVGRRTFSNGTTNSQQNHFDFRVSRLGLVPKFMPPAVLETIVQLPEVQVAVEALAGSTATSNTTLMDDLERATQVLESMQRGGKEHLAVVALKAELLQRRGCHDQAHATLGQLLALWKEQKHSSMAETAVELALVQAKLLWYMGDFEQAEACCEALLEEDHVQEMPIHYASALTGYGLSKIGLCQTLDDAFVVRDPCRMALKQLEQQQQTAPLIAAHLNLGVAEVVYGNVVATERDLDVPIDPALKTWTQGMTVVERRSSRSLSGAVDQAIMAALQVRLEANLAWGVLKIDDGMDDIVPEASEHAGNAISILDSITNVENNDKEFLRRVLTILATCYHKAGKAVTAEGLLQSATSLPSIGCILTKLDEISALQSYSDLSKDWDKRQSDMESYASKAGELGKALPESWQGKSSVLSSLWFWTPDEFVY